MPEDIALQVARKTSEDEWNIKDVMDIIRKEIEAREASKKVLGQERKRDQKELMKHYQHQVPSQATTKSFVARLETTSKAKKQIQCYFCDRNHFSNEFKEVTDVKQRKSILLTARRCFNDEVVTISALSSRAICSPLTSKVGISNYPHLQGLALADNSNANSKRIDILIGADHYYDIVIGDVIRSCAGPIAVSSRLGWLFSGPVSFSTKNDVKSHHKVNEIFNANSVLDTLPCRDELID